MFFRSLEQCCLSSRNKLQFSSSSQDEDEDENLFGVRPKDEDEDEKFYDMIIWDENLKFNFRPRK